MELSKAQDLSRPTNLHVSHGLVDLRLRCQGELLIPDLRALRASGSQPIVTFCPKLVLNEMPFQSSDWALVITSPQSRHRQIAKSLEVRLPNSFLVTRLSCDGCGRPLPCGKRRWKGRGLGQKTISERVLTKPADRAKAG